VPLCERRSALLLGVLTDRDVAMFLTPDAKPSSVLAQEALHRDPVTCRPELDVSEATRAMESAQVRRILVVDGDGKPVGVIAHADLALRARQRKDLEREPPLIMGETARPSA